ncbi:MAG: hypothetical protein HKN36_13340 [Hellea sp.]|nr:hypothetical protein [Hellea sp.]
MSDVLSLKPSYYEALKRLTLELAGVHLGEDHAFLVETRLGALARQEGYQSLNKMIDDLFGQGQTRLAVKVVSSLLERDTHFNPDPKGMKAIEEFLFPQLLSLSGSDRIRILSFACSSGQEPYSLAILADKFQKSHPNFSFEILGVDYPSPSLSRAQEGIYTHFEVQRGLPIRDLITYFDRVGENWCIKDVLRESVSFREFHLLSKLDSLGQFDLVLFRNSLAHYSSAAQIRVIRSLSSIVKAERYIMFGAEEALPTSGYNFDPIEGHPHVLIKHASPIEIEPEEERQLMPIIKYNASDDHKESA